MSSRRPQETEGPAGRPFVVGARRDEWIDLLAQLTDGFVRAIPDGGSPARAVLPGAPPDDQVPSIEGFARMSVAWAAWLHEPSNPAGLAWRGHRHDVASLLARGLADATDPVGRFHWGPIHDRDQRIVEAAEIATALWLGGARLRAALDAIDPHAHERVLDWLALVDGRDVWPDNWVLFPMIVALVRRAAGRPVDHAVVDRAVDEMVARSVGDGWTSDGAGHALDLYSGWAIHWHLLWWATLDGDRRPRLRSAVIRHARAWLRFVAPLVAPDGGFPRFGRSLGYRFALAAPFGQAALLGVDPLPPGVARSVAGRVVGRSLAEGAIDPATGWLRVGVGGERPAVVEGYVSAGAVAWAAHAFVGLALPEGHPFWSAKAAPAGGDGGSDKPPPSWTLPAAAAGLLAAGTDSGGTRLHNARTGHPADIPGHDYSATYGKLAYRSAFPFDVPRAHGSSAGSDDAIVAIEEAGVPAAVVHRNESVHGSAGPGWIATTYRLATRRPTTLRTVVLVAGDVEVRLTAVRPGSPVRLRDGGAALGYVGGVQIETVTDEADGMVMVRDASRVVAIRMLAGYDAVGTSDGSPERQNLVHESSRHPWVEELALSARSRIVVSATAATDRTADVEASLGTIGVAVDQTTGLVHVTGPGGTSALVSLGRHAPDRLELAGRAVRGTSLRVVLAADDGSSFAGERIRAVDGVFELTGPGIVEVRRAGSAVEATVAAGIRVDRGWSGAALGCLRVRDGAGPFGPPIRLAEAGVVPDARVRGLARRAGSRLVTIRLEPA